MAKEKTSTLRITERSWADGIHQFAIVLDGPMGTYSGPFVTPGKKSLTDDAIVAAAAAAYNIDPDTVEMVTE